VIFVAGVGRQCGKAKIVIQLQAKAEDIGIVLVTPGAIDISILSAAAQVNIAQSGFKCRQFLWRGRLSQIVAGLHIQRYRGPSGSRR
jgi:hypothetical protein